MELAVPAHLVRRSSHGIHHEGARSEKTDSDDREKNGSNARGLSVLKLGSDTTRKDEQQHSENNEIGDLNPAAWTERQFTDKHSKWCIARAKAALHREYRHKECRSNHACPCRKSVLIHSCFFAKGFEITFAMPDIVAVASLRVRPWVIGLFTEPYTETTSFAVTGSPSG